MSERVHSQTLKKVHVISLKNGLFFGGRRRSDLRTSCLCDPPHRPGFDCDFLLDTVA